VSLKCNPRIFPEFSQKDADIFRPERQVSIQKNEKVSVAHGNSCFIAPPMPRLFHALPFSISLCCGELADDVPALILLLSSTKLLQTLLETAFQAFRLSDKGGIVLFQHLFFVKYWNYDRNHPGSSIAALAPFV